MSDTLPMTLADSEAESWPAQATTLQPDRLLAAILGLTRELLEEWASTRPTDKRPARALDAAQVLLQRRTENAVLHARAVAKACTKARKDSFGYEHRIAEAARSVANAAAARPGSEQRHTEMCEALAKIEEHRLCAYANKAIYGKEHEVRTSMLKSLNFVLAALARANQATP